MTTIATIKPDVLGKQLRDFEKPNYSVLGGDVT